MQEPESRQPIIQCVLFIIFIAAPAAQPAASAGGGQPPLLTFYFLLLNPQGRAGRSLRRRRPAILDRICVLRWLQARDKSFGLKSRQPVAAPGEGLLSSSAAHRWLRTAATKAAAPIFNFPLSIFNLPLGSQGRRAAASGSGGPQLAAARAPSAGCCPKKIAASAAQPVAAPGEGLLASLVSLRRLRPAATKAIASHFQFSTFNFQFPPLAYSHLWLRRRYSVSAMLK